MASSLPEKYGNILADLKEKIRTAKTRAALSVNRQLLGVYWEIGRTIIDQQKEEGWGTKVIKRLATDLRSEFPDMKGLSERNLRYMQLFASAWPDFIFGQQPAAKFQDIDNQENTILQQAAALLHNRRVFAINKKKSPTNRANFLGERLTVDSKAISLVLPAPLSILILKQLVYNTKVMQGL